MGVRGLKILGTLGSYRFSKCGACKCRLPTSQVCATRPSCCCLADRAVAWHTHPSALDHVANHA